MSKRMLQQRYPKGKTVAQPAPAQPPEGVMPQWQGSTAAFQATAVPGGPGAFPDTQPQLQQQENSQSGWDATAYGARPAVSNAGGVETDWAWGTPINVQDPASVAAPAHPWSWGGGEATAPTPSWPQQPATDGYPSGDYSSGNYAPQGYPSDGYTLESYPSGTYPPETCPPGGYPSGNYSAGGYNPESYTTGDYQSGDYASMAPASAAQFSAAAAVAPQSFAPPDQAPQEGWMAPQWNDPQWGAGVVDPAAQGSLQAQPWVTQQWDATTLQQDQQWSRAPDEQWQDGTMQQSSQEQFDATHAPSSYASSAEVIPEGEAGHGDVGVPPEQRTFAPVELPSLVSSPGEAGTPADRGLPTGMDASERGGEDSTREERAADGGTVSVFFRDSDDAVACPESGAVPGSDCADHSQSELHHEHLQADGDYDRLQMEGHCEASAGSQASLSVEEPVNQEVPEPVPVLSQQEHGLASAQASQEVGFEVAHREGAELAQSPSAAKKAVIKARQGSPFRPPVARQGSEKALLQQNAAQLHLPPPARLTEDAESAPENLELPPDAEEKHASLRHPKHRTAPLPPLDGAPGAALGPALTLLDAPEMPRLVTLAPAAPPAERPPSGASNSGVQTCPEPAESLRAPLEGEGSPAPPAERVRPQGQREASVPMTRQSPLGGEEGDGRQPAPPPPQDRPQAHAALAASPPLVDSALPERTEPSGSTDRDAQVIPMVTASSQSLTSGIRPNATSTPTIRADPSTSMPSRSHPDDLSRHEEPRRAMDSAREPRDGMETRDALDGREASEVRDVREVRDIREVMDIRESRDGREPRDALDGREASEVRDVRDVRDIREVRDLREARDVRGGREARESRDGRDARDTGRDEGKEDRTDNWRREERKKEWRDSRDERSLSERDDSDDDRRRGGWDRKGARRDDRWDDRRDDRRSDRRDDRRDDHRDDRRDDRRDERTGLDRRDDRRDNRRDDRRGDERRYDSRDGRRDPRNDMWKSEGSDRKSDRHWDSSSRQRGDYRYEDRYEDRYGDRHGDRGRPSSRSSVDGYAETSDLRRGDRRRHLKDGGAERVPSRHSESDGSSPESRKGRLRRHRDRENEFGAAYYAAQQKGYGTDPYDYSAYRRDYYNYYQYGYAPRSGYGYGYYDELYRTNPAYKQQVDERYREYYARLGYDPAYLDRLSVHSGRSSANEDSRRDESFCSNTEDDCDPSILDGYTESTRLHEVSGERVARAQEMKKFSRPHPLARFSGANGLLKLIPSTSTSLPPPLELHDLRHILQKDPQFKELQAFPGPLIRTETHKNDVIQFCTQKIQSFADNPSLPDRSSHILLWELLILMLRQNGFVSGSDISELLLRGHEILEQSSLGAHRPGVGGDGAPKVAGSPPTEEAEESSPSPDEGIVVAQDRTVLGTGGTQVLAKFREFLLFGHKKDALDWAVKQSLWGHALSLASKMDARTYASIMTRFTNSLAVNDPLQTLYQHMSGRQPAAVTCIADEKWGDWRPHLAMILSNPSSRPEVDARSITTLGDVLASKGCLSASHFCYLMAQVEFGSFACKSSKMVLLGSSHMLPFEEFASNEAIQCTEIYEYSQSLANAGYMLPHLQVYKFHHATRLAEYGFVQEALHYCEVVAAAMAKDPPCLPLGVASRAYQLALRLKYHDPHFSQGQGELEELGDPPWLSAFALLLQACGDGQAFPGQAGYVGYEAPLHEEPIAETAHYQEDNSSASGAYGAAYQGYDTSAAQANYSSYQDPPAYAENTNATDTTADQYALSQRQQQQQTTFSTQGAPPTSSWNLGGMPQVGTDYGYGSGGTASGVHQQPLMNGTASQFAEAPGSPASATGTTSFDYYQASMHSEAQQQARRTSRERLSSISSAADPRDSRRDSVDSSGFMGRPRVPSGPRGSLQTETSGSDSERTRSAGNKPKPPVAGKSWLGGIFGKLLPKASNQMILPDDKDPDIVWDDQKKCWVDKNAGPGEAENKMMAPPSDDALGGKAAPMVGKPGQNRFQMNKQRVFRNNYVDILNPGGGAKTTKEATFPAPVAPALPESAVGQGPPPQFFIPQPPSDGDGTTSQGFDFVSPAAPSLSDNSLGPPAPPPESNAPYGSAKQPVSTPMMFDPAEFASRSSDSGTGHHVGGLGRRKAYPA
ncbi:uncharacterized protein LOC8036454 isoform X4 [Ixodes scapularis]|uniref:uncharacterized protein LOC8036454 isoform X4 n=1 Tax=Ixodes scapularis TaxID=6945 RepID=UPI001A9D0152|nr:uncharacterized protein LOC8036454 isoform X4 [Ixodes scapularis]